MYTGSIYYTGSLITIEQAVSASLITVDASGSIWLFRDTEHRIVTIGDLWIG